MAMLKRTLFFSNPCRLSTKNQQLCIERNESADTTQVPIEDIGFAVIENPSITATVTTLAQLIEHNISVIICNPTTHYPAGILLPIDGNTLQNERFEAQISASEPLSKQLWQQTITAKIENQARLLQTTGLDAKSLFYKAKHIKSGDTDNQEAQAARIYWQGVFSPIVFTRERFGLPPNNLLNYGYAILRAAVARALVGSGLLPTLGIHHHNRYNAFCLADDIMEPYRPFVDKIVREIVFESENGDYELTTALKARLLGVLTCDVMMAGQRSPLMVALSQTTASLVRCFERTDKTIKYPKLC
jgi:CRISP-associated protein Cas1